MQKYHSVFLALFVVIALGGLSVYLKDSKQVTLPKIAYEIGEFTAQKPCARYPKFLQQLKIKQPIAIDLSQQNHKGLAFLYGKGLKKAIHFKDWEQFDHFSSHALDPQGNLYLSPMPFISIKKNTFAFQKNIYQLDTNSGVLSVWMTLDEVDATKNNPYGIIALVYDCDDDTLWVSAIDESDYAQQKGVIYQIDTQNKKIVQRIEKVDALSLQILRSSQGKYLLYGSARESGLFALKLEKDGIVEAQKLFELPVANEYIRKISIQSNNVLKLQTIPFSYALISETSGGVRREYGARWQVQNRVWVFMNYH